jgi:glutathione S-transferase
MAVDDADRVVVWALPPVWGTPSASPFAIKVLTFLRMAEIPHERGDLRGPPRSSTGKIPYVELGDGEIVADSGEIVARLSRERGIDLDAGLSEGDRALGHAVRRMVEEHLYFVGAWDRWFTAAGFVHVARDYFAHLPAPLAFLLPRVLRRRMRRNLHGQGLGRLAPETILAHGRDDVAALAAILGEREFVLGPPSSVDASVYGFLCAVLGNPWASPVTRLVREHENLVAYTQRVRARWWAEGP